MKRGKNDDDIWTASAQRNNINMGVFLSKPKLVATISLHLFTWLQTVSV